jgi:hypothetical protein
MPLAGTDDQTIASAMQIIIDTTISSRLPGTCQAPSGIAWPLPMAPDPATAAYTWSRYRRLMRLLMAIALALMAVALRLAFQHAASASIRRYVIAALCVGLAMLLGSAVMGLSYLTRRAKFRAAGDNPPPVSRPPDAPG